MNSRIATLIAIGMAVLFVGSVLAGELTAHQIVDKSLTLDNAPTKISTYQMTVINKRGKKKVYKFKVWEKQFPDGEKKLIRFLEPADDEGTGLLTWEQEGKDDLQWLFLPAIRKARRLAASDRDSEFMSSDLYYEDMGALSADDYTHAILSEVMYQGHQCYLIESVPKPEINTAYSKMKSWIDKENFVGYKVELFEKNGTLLKTMVNKKVEQIDGFWTIMEAEVTRVNNKKGKTILKMLEREYNPDIPDNHFTTQFLERY